MSFIYSSYLTFESNSIKSIRVTILAMRFSTYSLKHNENIVHVCNNFVCIRNTKRFYIKTFETGVRERYVYSSNGIKLYISNHFHNRLHFFTFKCMLLEFWNNPINVVYYIAPSRLWRMLLSDVQNKNRIFDISHNARQITR